MCSLIYGYWGGYTTASLFYVYWNRCLPDSQHCLVSQRLPTELFSSAPFLHGAIFLVFQKKRGIKPQPISSSFPRWSNRMIQKHSHVHRHTHTHTNMSACTQPKHTHKSKRKKKKHKQWGWKTSAWSDDIFTEGLCRSPASCLQTAVYTGRILGVLWCVLCWHRAVKSAAVFSGKHTLPLISYLHALYI